MKKYCLITEDGLASFFDSDIHDKISTDAFEITNAQHEEILNKINKEYKRVFKTSKGYDFRDQDTKFDEKSQKWIKDKVAIYAREKVKIMNVANALFHQFYKFTNAYELTKLDKKQQNALFEYLKQLEDIISNKKEIKSIDDLPILPFDPETL